MSNTIKLKRGSGSDPSASDLVVGELAIRTDTGKIFLKKDNGNVAEVSGGGGVSDGDKGDITVSNSGDTFTIDNGVINNAKVASNAAIQGTKITPSFTSNISITNVAPKIFLTDSDTDSDFAIRNMHGVFGIHDQTNSADRFLIESDGTTTLKRTSGGGSDPILKVLHSNLSQGIALGYNTIAAIGSNTNVDLRLESKGTGLIYAIDKINAEAGLDVTGSISVSGTVDGVDIATRDTLFGGLTSSSGVLTNGVTATTQSAGDNSTKVATTAYTDTAISNLVDSSPSTLNTLNELAAALGDDANFSTTVTNSIATKLPLAGGTLTGDLTINESHPSIFFVDSGDNPDYEIGNHDGAFVIQDDTNGVNRLVVNSDGHIDIAGNLDVGNGIDVTGNVAASGTIAANGGSIFVTGTSPAVFFTDTDNNPDYYLQDQNGTFRLVDNTNSTELLTANATTLVSKVNHDFSAGIDVTGDITCTSDLILDSTNTDYPRITLHSNATGIRKYAIINGQGWNQDALLIYDVDGDNTRLTIEPNGLGINRGANSISHGLDVGGTAMIRGNTEIRGNISLSGDATTTNQNRTISFTGFDKESTGDFTDNAYIRHTVNTGGLAGSVLEIGSVNDSNDGIAFNTNNHNNNLRLNSNIIWNAGNDGSGSGLDADTLDGVQGGSFLRSDATDTASGAVTFTSTGLQLSGHWYSRFYSGTQNYIHLYPGGHTGNASVTDIRPWNGTTFDVLRITGGSNNITWRTHNIWNAGNDGSGSGLDADTVDGIQAASFLRSDANDDATGNYNFSDSGGSDDPVIHVKHTGSANGNYGGALLCENQYGNHSYGMVAEFRVGASGQDRPSISFSSGNSNTHIWGVGFVDNSTDHFRIRHGYGFRTGSGWGTTRFSIHTDGTLYAGELTNKIWHAGNDGSGSGLDADTLDGAQGSQFLRSDAADTCSGQINFTNTIISAKNGDRSTQGGNALILTHATTTNLRANHFIHDDFPSGKGTYYIQVTESGVSNDRNMCLQGYGGKLGIGTINEPTATVDISGTFKVSSTSTFSGDATFSGGSGAITLAQDADITFGTTGTWTGEKVKLQYHSNALYVQGGTSGVRLRGSDGGDMAHFTNTATTLYDPVTFNGGAGAVTITSSDIRSAGSSTWTGDPGGGTLKIQAHSNRWYIVSNSNSDRIVQFRQNSTDRTWIANDGQIYHGSSGTGDKYWRQGNDGSGSGLDSDTVDGFEAVKLYREIASASATVGAGWITVAENTSGRRHGEIIVSDTDSSDHGFIRIDWMRSYADSNFTVINCGGHSNRITGVRVLSQDSDNVYGNKKLQVYVTTNSTYRVQINQVQNQSGWTGHTVVTPVVQASISGYSVHGSQLEDLNDYSLASEEGIQAGAAGIKSNGSIILGSNNYEFRNGNNARNLYFFSGDTGSGTDIGISGYNGNSDWRFQLYGTGGSYGFLDGNWAGWDLKKEVNAAFYVDEGSGLQRVWNAGNDGSGSGLDADTVDGLQASSFLRVDTTNTVSSYGNRTRWYSNNAIDNGSGSQASLECFNANASNDAFMAFHVSGDFACYFGLDGGTNNLAVGGWSMGAASYKVWNQSNDGSGSGLDADLLDGMQANDQASNSTIVARNSSGYIFANYFNTTANDTGTASDVTRFYCSEDAYIRYIDKTSMRSVMNVSANSRTYGGRETSTTDQNYWIGSAGWGTTSFDTLWNYGSCFFDTWSNPSNQPSGTSHWTGVQAMHYNAGSKSNSYGYRIVCGAGQPALAYIGGQWGSSEYSWQKLWNEANDGSGSGLDADTLDGTQANALIRGGAQSSVSGWHISGYRNGSGTSPHMYFSHNAGYGMHINTYNTSDSVYAFELNSNSKVLFQVWNSGRCIHGGNVLPGAGNTYDLGSSSARWNNLYVNDMHFSNEGSQNSVDGSWGDWTLQEGENDIFMINNRSGKKFKIAMIPV